MNINAGTQYELQYCCAELLSPIVCQNAGNLSPVERAAAHDDPAGNYYHGRRYNNNNDECNVADTKKKKK